MLISTMILQDFRGRRSPWLQRAGTFPRQGKAEDFEILSVALYLNRIFRREKWHGEF
jgi:hypothetical protein